MSLDDRHEIWTRRMFLDRLALAGAAGLLGARPHYAAAAEPPPETTRIRIVRSPAICFAPQYVAEELLRAEGFTDVQYVKGTADSTMTRDRKRGRRFNGGFAGAIFMPDAGDPIVVLAGMHPGCHELFATQGIRSIRDLKGKQVAVTHLTSGRHILLAVMAVQCRSRPAQRHPLGH